eukprot:2709809-Amphidinium_carterae.1
MRSGQESPTACQAADPIINDNWCELTILPRIWVGISLKTSRDGNFCAILCMLSLHSRVAQAHAGLTVPT